MQIVEIKDIECAILHDRYAPISEQNLFDLVSSIARSVGLTSELRGGLSGEYSISASAGSLHVLVSQNPQPFGAEGFATVLAQPITKIAIPDAEVRVARHKANTLITISKGMHMPKSLLSAVNEYLPGLAAKSNSFNDHEELKVAVELAQRIAVALQRHLSCTAIYWCMCDQLVTPEFLQAIGKGPTLTPLCVRPNLFSRNNRLGPGLPLGMVANGAQYLVGRPIVFNEAAVDLPWMLERVSNFIDMAHLRGSVTQDGASFGISNDEVIKVVHMPPSRDYPFGTYTLTATHVPQFGIFDPTRALSAEANDELGPVADTEAKLNPNDPIDRLILDRLEERRLLDDRRTVEDRRSPSSQSPSNQADYPNDRRAAATFGRREIPFGRRI